jgi:hypothetical protein
LLLILLAASTCFSLLSTDYPGESAQFVWKRSWKKALALERLLLRSGDILIFGGAARAMVHGVERLEAGSAPAALRLGADPGWRRLCITCREH